MNVQKKIAFYGALANLLNDEESFVESSAEALVKLYEEIKADVFITDVTMDVLREAFRERWGDWRESRDTINALVDEAFKDLAKHMRSPEVQKIFQDFVDMSGTGGDEDLFVWVSKVRPLNDDPNGPAVITLVVDRRLGFDELLKGQGGGIQYIHSV